MVVKTQSPSVVAGINSQPRLPCQFALDHRAPNVMVEWHFQHRGERHKLFRYKSRSGEKEGSGVEMKRLAAGDISYVLPRAKISNEGMYICSVSVEPLFVSVDVNLHIEGERVFLEVVCWFFWVSQIGLIRARLVVLKHLAHVDLFHVVLTGNLFPRC